MKKISKIFLIILILAIQISVLMAQPGGPGGGPGGGDPPVGGGTGIPLDGGALELLLAGLVYFGFTRTKAWFKIKK